MKQILKNSFIYLVCIFGVAWVYRYFAKKQGPLVRVVCFHDVKDSSWFESTIEMLQNKYHILSVSEFEQRKFSTAKINILLSFDDGYQSWVTTVLPIFKKYNLQGLFFVNSGLLDANKEGKGKQFLNEKLLLQTERILLSWDELKTLVEEGQIIGGHTVGHTRLSSVSKDQVRQEVGNDKCALETFLGTKLNHFAYPFGAKSDFSEAITEQVIGEGYEFVYSAVPGWYHHNVSSNAIPRLLLEERLSLKPIQCWINGGYDIFQFLKKITFLQSDS